MMWVVWMLVKCLVFYGVVFVLFNLGRSLLATLYTLPPDTSKVVVITGCDSGFGHDTALKMSGLGFQVVACCLTKEGLKLFSHIPNVYAIQMDITKEKSVENAFTMIQQKYPQGIWALINNAGICDGYYFEFTPMETYRKVMEVNLFGHILVTKLALPMLKKTKGRVINMASLSGRIPTPEMSAYTTSKHAMIGWTTALMEDLVKFGIQVISIQPFYMATPIITKISAEREKLLLGAPLELREEYGGAPFVATENQAYRKIQQISESPAQVVEAYINATISAYPKDFYIVGRKSYFLLLLASVLPHKTALEVLRRL